MGPPEHQGRQVISPETIAAAAQQAEVTQTYPGVMGSPLPELASLADDEVLMEITRSDTFRGWMRGSAEFVADQVNVELGSPATIRILITRKAPK